MNQKSVCIQEEFNQKINLNIDLITKLETAACPSAAQEQAEIDQNKQDLNELLNSSNVLLKNELFMLNFKTNQIIHIAALKATRLLINSNPAHKLKKDGVVLLTHLFKLIELNDENYEQSKEILWRVNYHETFFLEVLDELMEIFRENLINVENNLNMLESVYAITPIILNSCQISKLLQSKYISGTVSIINTYSSFDIKKYSWTLCIIISELSKVDPILTNRNYYSEALTLVYDGICILESEHKNDPEIREYFFRILSSEAKLFCNLLSTSQNFTNLIKGVTAKKKKFFQNLVKCIRDAFKKSGTNKINNKCLDGGYFDALSCLLENAFESDKGQLVDDYEELAVVLCEGLSLYKKEGSSISEYHITKIFKLLSLLIGKKKIPLNTFLEKYWIDYLEPTWNYLFKHENHKKFDSPTMLFGFLNNLNKDNQNELLKYIISNFKDLFELDYKREKSIMSSNTARVLLELIRFSINHKLVELFEQNMVPLLDLLIRFVYRNNDHDESNLDEMINSLEMPNLTGASRDAQKVTKMIVTIRLFIIKGIVLHHSSKLCIEKKAQLSYFVDQTKQFFERIKCDDFNQAISEISDCLV